MSLTTEQKVDLLYKKLFNRATSDLDRKHFEEALSRDIILNTQVWKQPPDPTSAVAVSNQLFLIDHVAFTPVYGTESAYSLGYENIVPFNYGTTPTAMQQAPTGYNYLLLDNASANEIPFGTNDWYLDPSSGILIFFGGNPSGVSPSLPPRIVCYQYTGILGTDDIPTQLEFDSSDLVAGVLTWNHGLGYLGLMPSITDGSGQRIEPTNVEDSDSNTMLIDLTGYTVSGIWLASLSL